MTDQIYSNQAFHIAELILSASGSSLKHYSMHKTRTEILDAAQSFVTQLEDLRKQRDELREALKLCDAYGKRANIITAPEDWEVKNLCQRVGYGAVMDSAARLWFLKDNVGAFTIGPCAATVRSVLTKTKGSV